jgi:hypothetical protein
VVAPRYIRGGPRHGIEEKKTKAKKRYGKEEKK